MKYAVAAALFAGALAVSSAHAAPRAKSVEECGLAADMAIVAASLAQEHIQRQRADAIMQRIYDVAASERGSQLMREITDAAYIDAQYAGADSMDSASAGGTVPRAGGTAPRRAGRHSFAEDLFTTCIQGGGNMDAVLGRRS